MIMAFVDPIEAMFNLQRALDARLTSDWLQDQTTSEGPFPAINVFQQGGDLLAIIELPGIDKSSLQIEAYCSVSRQHPSLCATQESAA